MSPVFTTPRGGAGIGDHCREKAGKNAGDPSSSRKRDYAAAGPPVLALQRGQKNNYLF